MKLDERGWRIPKEGTKTHTIYLGKQRGLTNTELARQLNISKATVGVLIWRYKNPVDANYRNKLSRCRCRLRKEQGQS